MTKKVKVMAVVRKILRWKKKMRIRSDCGSGRSNMEKKTLIKVSFTCEIFI